jgi:hypothetical protein
MRRALKMTATVTACIVLAFFANSARSGTNEPARSVATQSILSLPSDADPKPGATAVPTTAPLAVPTAIVTTHCRCDSNAETYIDTTTQRRSRGGDLR